MQVVNYSNTTLNIFLKDITKSSIVYTYNEKQLIHAAILIIYAPALKLF